MAASPEVVLQAILAIHNGHTSAEDRRQAGQICEDVKADPIAAMNAANMLIRPAQPDPARHFGLSLLGTVIEQRWHQAGFEQEQMQIKQLILEMMAGGTKPLLEEAAFIKEKLCSLVSAVGCREWPQRWETMLPDLMGIAAMGHEQQELMLLALRVLGEDIMEFNDKLDAGRRADLSQALKILLPQILQWVYGFIEEKYQQFTAVVGQGGAGGNDARTLQQLVSAAVKLLQSYTQWIPLHLIYRHNLSQIFSTLLHDPAFKVPACECLLLLCSRKVSRISNKKDKLEAGSTDEDVATSKAQLLAVVGTLGEAPLGGPAELLADPDNAYKFAKRVSQVIVAIGDFQIDVFDPSQEAALSQYLALLVMMASHQAITVSTYPLKTLCSLLRNQEMQQRPQFQAVLGDLVELFFSKLPRISDPFEEGNGHEHVSAQFSLQDFDDEDDYKEFYGLHRSQLVLGLRELTKLLPVDMMQCAHRKLEEVNSLGQNARCGLDDPAVPTEAVHDAVLSFTEIVMNTIPNASFAPDAPEQAQHVAVASELVTMMLAFQPLNDPLRKQQIHALSRFAKFFSFHLAQLGDVMDKMLMAAVYLGSGDGDLATLSTGTQTIRYSACTSMAHLCKNIDPARPAAPHLMPNSPARVISPSHEIVQQQANINLLENALPHALGRFQEMQSQLRLGEEALLIEGLLCLFNYLPTFEFRQQYITDLLEPKIREWNEAAAANQLDSIAAIDAVMRLHAIEGAEPVAAPDFMALKHRLSIFASVTRRLTALPPAGSADGAAVHPFKDLLPHVLPHVCAVIVAVDNLWQPGALDGVMSAEAARMLLGAGEWEQKQTIGKRHTAADEPAVAAAEGGQHGGRAWLGNLQIYLQQVRETCYELAEAAFKPEFQLADEALAAVMEAVFRGAHQGALQNRHLLSLLKTLVAPMIAGCPQVYWAPLLDPSIGPFLEQLQARLAAGWEVAAAKGDGDDGEEDDIAVVFENAVTRSLTQRLLQAFANTQVHMIETESLVQSFLPLVASCLSWPDGAACARARLLLNRAIPHLAPHETFHQYLGEVVVTNLLMALLKGTNPEVHPDLIALLYDLYSAIPEAVRATVLSMPNMNPGAVSALEAQLAAEADKKIGRTVLKRFLKEAAGAKIEQWIRPPTIISLPEQLVMHDPTDDGVTPEQAEAVAYAGAAALFGGDDS